MKKMLRDHFVANLVGHFWHRRLLRWGKRGAQHDCHFEALVSVDLLLVVFMHDLGLYRADVADVDIAWLELHRFADGNLRPVLDMS